MVGVGEAAYAPAAQAMIPDSFPGENRALAQAIFASGMLLGGAAGVALGGIMGEHHSWQRAFIIVGALGILPVLLALKLKEPPRRPRSEVVALRELLSVPAYVAMIAAGTCITFQRFPGRLGLRLRQKLQRSQHQGGGDFSLRHPAARPGSRRPHRRIPCGSPPQALLLRTPARDRRRIFDRGAVFAIGDTGRGEVAVPRRILRRVLLHVVVSRPGHGGDSRSHSAARSRYCHRRVHVCHATSGRAWPATGRQDLGHE